MTGSHLEVLRAVLPKYFQTHAAQIPTLSARATQIMASASRVMQADTTELAIMVRSDAVATATLMRVANSPLYRRTGDVQSVQEAIVRIGRREVYALLLALANRSLFEPQVKRLHDVLPNQWYRIQHHAVVCAFATGWLANKLGVSPYEPAFVAGMFHDIGKLGALYSLAGIILDGKVDFEVSFNAAGAIMEEFHVPFGVALLKKWQLPKQLIDICARSHIPLDPIDPLGPLLNVVRVVSSLNVLRANAYVPDSLHGELRGALDFLRINERALRSLGPRLQAITDHVTQLVGPPTRGAEEARS